MLNPTWAQTKIETLKNIVKVSNFKGATDLSLGRLILL